MNPQNDLVGAWLKQSLDNTERAIAVAQGYMRLYERRVEEEEAARLVCDRCAVAVRAHKDRKIDGMMTEYAIGRERKAWNELFARGPATTECTEELLEAAKRHVIASLHTWDGPGGGKIGPDPGFAGIFHKNSKLGEGMSTIASEETVAVDPKEAVLDQLHANVEYYSKQSARFEAEMKTAAKNMEFAKEQLRRWKAAYDYAAKIDLEKAENEAEKSESE